MEQRSKRMIVYVEPSVFEALDKLAAAEGLTLSTLVYSWLTERMEKER